MNIRRLVISFLKKQKVRHQKGIVMTVLMRDIYSVFKSMGNGIFGLTDFVKE